MINMRKLQSPLYTRDVITIKEYQDKDKTFWKIVYHSCMRNAGVETPDDEKEKQKKKKENSLNKKTFKEMVESSQFLQGFTSQYDVNLENFKKYKKEYFKDFTEEDVEGFCSIFGTFGDGLRFTEKDFIDYIEKVEKGKNESTVMRARNTIFEYASCNDFDYFVTLTLSPEKVKNRDDLEGSYKIISQWFKDYKKKNKDFIYLLVPEKHKKNGVGWHFHGLMRGIPTSDLTKFEIGQKMSSRMADLIKNGRCLYNWTPWSEKFGFNDIEMIHNKEAVEKYITKYCSKDLGSDVKQENAHLYYCSKGLKKAQKIAQGIYSGEIDAHDTDFFDYIGDYCSCKIVKDKNEMLRLKDLLIQKNKNYFDDFSVDVDTGEIFYF